MLIELKYGRKESNSKVNLQKLLFILYFVFPPLIQNISKYLKANLGEFYKCLNKSNYVMAT